MKRTPAKLHQISNARFLMEVVGVRAAAAYLRKLGWSLEAAKWILLRT